MNISEIHIDEPRLLDRFLRYVQIETTADPDTEVYPSSPGQKRLGEMLVQELRAMGIVNAEQDTNALVWATIPASTSGDTNRNEVVDQPSAILLNAHLDTSPEAPGANVKPIVHRYQGGNITLPAGGEINMENTRELEGLIGKTLITSDGSTLLGGDDKAGVAIIMELANTLMENPGLKYPEIRILFTCDEEIGRGALHFDCQKAASVVGYTLDGGGAGVIDCECFSADSATVSFIGRNIHPAIAKGRMRNAMRGASQFVASLVREMRPETTDGREGFIHPYQMTGSVERAEVKLILRDFVTEQLAFFAETIRRNAKAAADCFELEYDIKIQPQYRNMGDGIAERPEAITLAEEAFRAIGVQPKRDIIRGGTDGAVMTSKGLPTPNLASGQYNIHSKQEFACLDEMLLATRQLIVLLDAWAGRLHGS